MTRSARLAGMGLLVLSLLSRSSPVSAGESIEEIRVRAARVEKSDLEIPAAASVGENTPP